MPEHNKLIFFICLFVIIGILLISGHALSLINVPASKRKKYDERRLGKFVGMSMFGYAAGFGLILAGEYYSPLFRIYGAIFILVLSVFMIIGVITGNGYINKKKQ